jgi:hypothetical protein
LPPFLQGLRRKTPGVRPSLSEELRIRQIFHEPVELLMVVGLGDTPAVADIALDAYERARANRFVTLNCNQFDACSGATFAPGRAGYFSLTVERASMSRCVEKSTIESNAGPLSGLVLSISAMAALTLSIPSGFCAM